MFLGKVDFYSLTPDVILEAVESVGFVPTGSLLQLNSYENRVYEIRLEKDTAAPEFEDRLIGKFYRPQRWSRQAILEEHFFSEELKHAGIPAIAPLAIKSRDTLSSYEGIMFALFPKCLGRIPQELNHDQLQSVGRALARLHNVGEQGKFKARLTLDAETYGWPILKLLEKWVAPEVWSRYEAAGTQILECLEDRLEGAEYLRIHGDCHKGNLLLADRKDGSREFFFVDFDDSCMGPAAQDFWMLRTSVDTQEELESLLSGYEELRHFDHEQLELFEPLRGLRILHYAGWIARRWTDPSFPMLFPEFRNYNYWAEEVEALERIAWSL